MASPSDKRLEVLQCDRGYCTNPVAEPHTCPYAVEINEDSETLCSCCEGCESECAWDI